MGPTKRRMGDRKDGWRVTSLLPFYQITPFLMRTRNDASNYFQDSLEITDVEKYIKEKRAQGMKGFGMLHIFIAAYIRTMSQRPWLNRFVSGQRIYARRNIIIALTVKKEMTADSEESTIKMVFDHRETAESVYYKIMEEVSGFKSAGGTEENKTLNVARAFMKLPRPILRFAIAMVRWLDYHGWVPNVILEASPFHGSMFISNLASLGIPPIYHHLYDFGNVPVFITFGSRRREYELQADGSAKERRMIDFTVVTDERICDGFYFAKAFKLFKQYIRKPQLLDIPPETVYEDEH